jgi:hypothetical protein
MAKSEGGITKSYAFSKWLYGMNLLKNFMAFQRLGEEMLFVNFNNLANTHSQSAMETPKEGAYLTASGRALQLLSNSPAAWLLAIENYKPGADDEYQVQAAWDISRKKLVLYICNRTAIATNTVFDLGDLKASFTTATTNRLQAASPVSMNTLSDPEAIKRTTISKKISLKKNTYPVEIPAYSFTEVILE